MDKIIVYGLGNSYKKYREYIYKNYQVVGVTSSDNTEAAKHRNYIPCEELKGAEFDYIFVCSMFEQEIVNKLVDDIGIAKEKIMINTLHLNKNGIFHAQVNEDAVCLLILQMIGVKIDELRYLDIGAHHPVNINNTYLFYLLGGSGTLVEPNEEFRNLIEIVRPRDQLICKAISLDGEKKKFYKLKASTLNTILYEKLDLDFCNNIDAFTIQDQCVIETITINDLFETIGEVPDLFSIDIECLNFEVLSQLDMQKYRPKVIIAELTAYGEKLLIRDDMCELLEQNNYVLVAANEINGIFIDKKYENSINCLLKQGKEHNGF